MKFFRLLILCIALLQWSCVESVEIIERAISAPQTNPFVVGSRAPDLNLIDHRGRKLKLSELKGKPIVIELIGMSCAGCQAFSGGNRPTVGGFGGIKPQVGLQEARRYFKQYGGLTLTDSRLHVVQLLLYDLEMKSPNPDHAKSWAKHFELSHLPNTLITVTQTDMRSPAIQRVIPAFALIDKDFIVRAFSDKRHQPNNLYTELMPMVKSLLKIK